MEDEIIVHGPLTGDVIGKLTWRTGTRLGDGYYYDDGDARVLGENTLLYIAGLIKSANAARRRQNQK